MKIYRCPQNILNMFDKESDKPEARKKTNEWLNELKKFEHFQVGDILWLPNYDTGELECFVKQSSIQ